MEELKQSGLAHDLQRIGNFWGGIIPAAYQSVFEGLINPIQPMFNMTCTNVPGPQIPLYFNGIKMERYLPMVPVGHQIGLGCPIFTYNQAIVIGMTADTRACPDVVKIKEFMDESFEEVRTAAGVDRIEPIAIPQRQRSSKRPKSRGSAKPVDDADSAVSVQNEDVDLESPVTISQNPA